jgi:autotransporter-associated beta strand protein
MKLTNSNAAEVGTNDVKAIASATALFRQFMVYSATTISSVISGAIGLVKNGTGTLTLSGSNTYTGSTTINAGTLTANGGSAIANASAVSVGSGAVFNLGASETVGSIAGAGNITLGSFTLTAGGDNSSTTASGVISGTGALTKTGTGALTLSGANTYNGTTTVSAGTLKAGSNTGMSSASTLTVNGGAFDLNGFNATVASVGVGNAAGTITNSAPGSGTNTLTITNYNVNLATLITDGATAKTAVTLYNNGGATPISNANNTFSGGFTIAYGGSGGGSRLYQGSVTNTVVGGILTKSNLGTGTLTIGANGSTASAQLYLNSGSIYNNIIVNAAQYADGGLAAFRLDGSGIQFYGTMTANSSNINLSSQITGSATLNGQLTGTNGLLLKTPSGVGATFTLTLLNASNNYLGNTTTSTRTTIVISGAGQLGSGNYSGSIANTGSFIYSSTANQILSGTITGTGQWIKNATSTLTLSGTFSGTTGPITVNDGTLALGANQTLPAIAGAGNINIGIYNLVIATGTINTFSGVISGSGTFRKTSTGIQTLSGNLTYTGSTQISNGTLQVTRAFGSITPTASFEASTLAVSFTGTFPSGTTEFRFFQGTTINSYASVSLTGVPVGTTATYNSANSTLSVIVP